MSKNTLPDPKQAYDTIFTRVHANVFFHKLAAAGFQPRSQAEAEYMLDTAAKLRTIQESTQVKQAATQENPYYQLNQSLDTVMNQYGFAGRPRYQEAEIGYKQAADTLMQDPEIYDAVLALKAAEYAEQV